MRTIEILSRNYLTLLAVVAFLIGVSTQEGAYPHGVLSDWPTVLVLNVAGVATVAFAFALSVQTNTTRLGNGTEEAEHKRVLSGSPGYDGPRNLDKKSGSDKVYRTMRKRYTAAFKAQVVQELLRGEKTIAQIAAAHKVPNMLSQWKSTDIESLPVSSREL